MPPFLGALMKEMILRMNWRWSPKCLTDMYFTLLCKVALWGNFEKGNQKWPTLKQKSLSDHFKSDEICLFFNWKAWRIVLELSRNTGRGNGKRTVVRRESGWRVVTKPNLSNYHRNALSVCLPFFVPPNQTLHPVKRRARAITNRQLFGYKNLLWGRCPSTPPLSLSSTSYK